MIKIVIPLEPVAQGRPRFSNRVRFVTTYDPPKSMAYKKQVRMIAQQQYHDEPIAKGNPLILQVTFYRSIQKSMSKAEYQRRLKGETLPFVKPDIDNYFKAVTDGLTGVIWADDNQITDVQMSKRYSDKPRTEITIWKIEEGVNK